MTIINLIPLIRQSEKSKTNSLKLPRWDSPGGRDTIVDSLEATEQVMQLILPTADEVVLMWGDPASKKFPWKREALEVVIPIILEHLPENAAVKAVPSKFEPHYPVHPGYKIDSPIRQARYSRSF